MLVHTAKGALIESLDPKNRGNTRSPIPYATCPGKRSCAEDQGPGGSYKLCYRGPGGSDSVEQHSGTDK